MPSHVRIVARYHKQRSAGLLKPDHALNPRKEKEIMSAGANSRQPETEWQSEPESRLPEKKSRRVQVVFDDRALEVLERLQASTGGSIAEVVRDALGFYDWAREQTIEGKSVAVIDHANNRVREFILPFRRGK